ncbi:MAG: HemK2/MTQ2 family protein methyltransferase [bacterium]
MIPRLNFDLSPILRECKKHDYQLTKVLPVVPKRLPGIGELHLLVNLFTNKRTCSFNPSFFRKQFQADFRRRHPDAYTLFEAFIRNDPLPREKLRKFFSEEELHKFIKQGIATRGDDNRIRFEIRLFSFMDRWFVTDRFDRSTQGLTYCGIDSLVLAEENLKTFYGKRHFQSCLDIGTGTGLQGICASEYCERITGIDINPRAVTYSKINASINGLDEKRFQESDLFTGVKGRYELIISNPPFMFYPREELGREEHLDGDGGKYGLEIVGTILDRIDRFLEKDGVARILAQSPMVGDQDLLPKLIREKFSRLDYQVTLKPLCYFMNPTHFFFYRQQGIRYCTLYLITLHKGKTPFTLSVDPMPSLRKAADFLKTGLVYAARQLIFFH